MRWDRIVSGQYSMQEMDNIDWANDAPILYHSAFDNCGFSKRFRDRYWELTGGHKPGPWPHDSVRIDNRTSLQVVQEIGIDNCGEGLTVATVPRKALPALRILDTDGCEYPHLDSSAFVVHYIQQHFRQGATSLDRSDFAALVAESKMLHIRIIPRRRVSPSATTSVSDVPVTTNRFQCLADHVWPTAVSL